MINRNARKVRDARMADLTDRLLAGERPDATIAAESDQELREAQETVQMLQRAVPYQQPTMELQNRIRARLAAEWGKTGPQSRQESGRWNRTLVVRFAVIAAVILLVVLAAFPFSNFATPGAAGNGSLWAPAILVGIIILILIIWQVLRNKRR